MIYDSKLGKIQKQLVLKVHEENKTNILLINDSEYGHDYTFVSDEFAQAFIKEFYKGEHK